MTRGSWIRSRGALLLTLAVLMCGVKRAEAVPTAFWTYKLLWSESDVVVIGTLNSTKMIENKEYFLKHLDCFESEIRIHAVLKGDTQLNKAALVHFRYKPNANVLGNGPRFAVLGDHRRSMGERGEKYLKEAAKDKNKRMVFLFFLKRRSDGRYAPVSGNGDALYSVARIGGYAFADLEEESKEKATGKVEKSNK